MLEGAYLIAVGAVGAVGAAQGLWTENQFFCVLSVSAFHTVRAQLATSLYISTVGLVFTQVWGYAKVWVLGRFWLRLGPRL